MSLFFVLLFFAQLVSAQTGSSSKSVTNQATPQSVYLTKPLPLSIDTVGPNFKGHDVVTITAQLKRLGVPKSELETTQEYERRIKTLMASKVRQYAFVLDEFTATANYNADNKVMNVSVTAPLMVGLFDGDIHEANDPTGDSTYFSSGFELRSILRSTTQHVAMNAFGVKINVTSSTFDEFGVVISKDDALFADVEPCCDHMGTREAVLSLDMDVQTAKALKPFLRVALVCTLVNPTVYKGTGGSGPTIASPREIITEQQYLLVHPDELWVYDKRSGRILGKFIPAEERKLLDLQKDVSH